MLNLEEIPIQVLCKEDRKEGRKPRGKAAKKENEPKKIAVEKMDVTVAEEDVVQEALAVQDEDVQAEEAVLLLNTGDVAAHEDVQLDDTMQTTDVVLTAHDDTLERSMVIHNVEEIAAHEEVQGDDDMQERTAELEQEAPENVAMDAMSDGDDDEETEEVHDGDNVEMVGGARDAAEPTDADDDGSVDMRGAGDYANEDSNVSDSMDFVDGAGDARALEVLIEADAVANVQEEVMNAEIVEHNINAPEAPKIGGEFEADRQLEESQAGVDQNRSSDALSICGVAEFRQFISTNQHMTMLHQVIMMNNDMPTSVPGLDVRFCHVAQYLTMFETALQSRL
ncbi:unnamed protein product [Nippostrongylus brasiliensis]|uniref:Midasin n=1 Tax=Nippostrongylus brasiliensis TaxID=27835 RepID=A0A158R0F3_NIPBR|nr:unnamed protein product [Nippostrongylus brasiliensis]